MGNIGEVLSIKKIRFVVAGATGYLGSHLIGYLNSKGIPCMALGRKLPKERKIYVHNQPVIDWKTDEELVKKLKDFGGQVIVNASGYYSRGETFNEINNYVDGNILFPSKLALASIFAGAKRFVHVGSLWEWDQNGDARQRNYYSYSKYSGSHALDVICKNYRRDFLYHLKINDTYGGHDNREKLIPYIKKCITENQEIEIANINKIVNFVHVDDVIQAILKISNFEDFNKNERVFSLLSNESVSIRELLEKISKVVGNSVALKAPKSASPVSSGLDVWVGAPKIPNFKFQHDLGSGLMEYFHDTNTRS